LFRSEASRYFGTAVILRALSGVEQFSLDMQRTKDQAPRTIFGIERYFDCHSTKKGIVDGDYMFMRFVSSEIDENSHVSAGLFCAAFKLLDEMVLTDHEYAAVADLMAWFNVNLRGPFEYRLKSRWRARRSICWFRCTAYEHLARARELATILEGRDVFIRSIRCQKTGYILYEDEVQVLAQPFADMRLRL
jgi:hypothetical protein